MIKKITGFLLSIGLAFAFILSLSLAQPLLADYIKLKDGNIVEGTITKKDDRSVTIVEKNSGETLVINRVDIKELKEDEHKKKIKETFIDFTMPRILAFPGFLVPMGDIGSKLNSGFGVSMAGDMIIPQISSEDMNIYTRGGISFGYASLASSDPNLSGSVTLLPITANVSILYPLSMGLYPYFTLGAGVTLTTLDGTANNGESVGTSSTDLSVAAGLGLGYNHPSLPYMEFILEAKYFIAFEKVNGTYLIISLGIGYKFGT